ncbi:hypothetical protein Q5691_13575 [Microcoleus sp. w1-18aA5]|uniref:hypothetical protein n=1 Tax=unclassified Microcoleus TaxID=2642155 RepID=UPI002FD12B71
MHNSLVWGKHRPDLLHKLDRHQYTKLLAIRVTIAPRHSFISSPNKVKSAIAIFHFFKL